MRFLLAAAGIGAAILLVSVFAITLASGGGKPMFQATTYDELLALPEADRMIAAVQCEEAALVNRGSRSERALLTVRVLHGAENVKYEAPMRLTRYTQGDTLMKRGEVYLVVAYRGEWLPAWNLVDLKPVDRADAAAALHSALDELAARLKGKKP
jgi:hypothetical protein